MLASGHSWRAGHSVGETFLLYPVQNVLLLFNTTRAHTPDPQARTGRRCGLQNVINTAAVEVFV